MKIGEMVTLLKSGYTKAEITAMIAEEKAEAEKPETKPEDKQETKPEEKPETKPEEKPVDKTGNAEILAELKKMNDNMEAMNIMNTVQPVQKSADDVLENLMKEVR